MKKDMNEHWENVFYTKKETDVSWYQEVPKTSIDILLKYNISKNSPIIDVGCGDSYFVDYLVNKGFQNIYALDISENALCRLKDRLGDDADKVNWIVGNVLDFKPPVMFDFWHDRASFHFQTKLNTITQYYEIANSAISKGGIMTIGTFSKDGPSRCSGLDICQYDEEELKHVFSLGFEKLDCQFENHATPFDTVQNFIFCEFKKL